MSRAVFPIWMFVAVAAFIVLAAFGLAQFLPQKGMPFVAMVSGLWVAYCAVRARRVAR